MKIIQFTYPETPEEIHSGCIVNKDKVIDLNKIADSLGSVLDILRKNQLEIIRKIVNSNPPTISINDIKLVAPITNVDKVLCVGMNYKDYCDSINAPHPEVPTIFSKFASNIIGDNDVIKLRTNLTQCVDWEVELAIVIGKKGTNIKKEDYLEYIAGYTIAQDISARDWMTDKNGGQVLLGKTMDGFCPLGPWIVTADEIKDPHNLKVKCSVNGSVKQDSCTHQLICRIPQMIERISSVMTLLPGDVILTGTPTGVGMNMKPPQYLKPGDVIETEIEGIGILKTKCEQF